MPNEWIVSMKQSFQSEWLALPAKESHQVLEKINLLLTDPFPDAKVKKRLKYVGHDLCRIRAGDHRLFYTVDKPYVSLLALRRRQDHTYDDETLDDEFLGGFVPEVGGTQLREPPDWERLLQPKSHARPLPRPIDQDLLRNLQVPTAHHRALLRVKDEDELLACPGIDDETLLRVHEAPFERTAPEVLQAREFVVQDTNDLLRFKEGSLLGFLLRLDQEQERYVTWAVAASGPTLVKGGPGTGKSTVALYRVRSMLQALAREGVSQPRVLFTTYTNAIVAFSQQLLRGLLGDDADLVDVRTADSLVMKLVSRAGGTHRMATTADLRRLLQDAIAKATFEGSSLQRQSQALTVTRLGPDYLLDEVCGVIDARRLATLDAYLQARRPGRRVPLSETQRRAVWAVRTALHHELDEARMTTWQRLRGEAAALVEQGHDHGVYDAVIVDEAQDLDPAVLQLLVGMCKAPSRLFLTADANQSIYGAGFRWADVHDGLRFRGRTGILRLNHRSTAEIGVATTSYLADGVLDTEDQESGYVNHGPLPAVRRVASQADEALLLARFLAQAAREFHLGIGACAVLVPTERTGRRIADALQAQKVDARFMTGRELELAAKCVKVLTLKSSKGLEFPIVAVAGFLDLPWPVLKPEMTDEERQERLAQERRTMFVAMSRAMRALLVAGPETSPTPLLEGFDRALWNVE